MLKTERYSSFIEDFETQSSIFHFQEIKAIIKKQTSCCSKTTSIWASSVINIYMHDRAGDEPNNKKKKKKRSNLETNGKCSKNYNHMEVLDSTYKLAIVANYIWDVKSCHSEINKATDWLSIKCGIRDKLSFVTSMIWHSSQVACQQFGIG